MSPEEKRTLIIRSCRMNSLTAPFRTGGRLSKTLLCIFILLNGLTLVNSCFHDPAVGYDAAAHLSYVESLARARLPSPADTHEFFSPPLPYVFPAFLMGSGLVGLWWAAKSAQLLNAVLSVGLTFSLLKICDLVKPDGSHLKVAALLLSAILPLYYKTFAFVRGEPFVVFFALVAVYQALLIFAKDGQRSSNVILLGVALGLLVLSRQWGVLLFPALILWCGILALKDKQKRPQLLKALAAAGSISILVGAWFYLTLLTHYGSVTAFSRTPQPQLSFSNHPGAFYFGLGSDKFFSDPIRPSFPNQLMPIFYSDTWGDYWGYFVVYGKDSRTGAFVQGFELAQLIQQEPQPEWLTTNRHEIASYLARVNRLALFPTALAVAGFLFGVAQLWRLIRNPMITRDTAVCSLCTLLIASSLLGYLWFLLRYPNPGNGDTIKPTYMLQIFPFTCILAGSLLDSVRRRSTLAYTATLTLLGFVFAHNVPVVMTRYIP